jgi:hypothetical protein
MSEMGAMSLTGSQDILPYRNWFIVCVLIEPISRV